MARYIDADALLSRLPNDLPYKASVKRVLMQAPDVDVVPKSEWISVDEGLPENDYGKHWKERQHYLVMTEPSGLMRVARFGSKEFPWWIDSHDTVMTSANYAKVTHWMPLPEPPKMKGGE
jgi:hypothetical protein